MSFQQFLQKNLYIRYILLAVTILVSIYMVQAITQNSSMDITIMEVDEKIEKTKRETIFLEHIYKPYLQSELAYYVLMHEQSLLLPGEKIIRLDSELKKETPLEEKKESTMVIPLIELPPKDAWTIFFQQLQQKNFPIQPEEKNTVEFLKD